LPPYRWEVIKVAAGAFQEVVRPYKRAMVALPPCKSTGIVKYDRIFVSLASDFEGAHVRLAIGKPGQWDTIQDNLAVPAGRSFVFELKPATRLRRWFTKEANR
jgi:hypothetical protein